MPHPFGSSISVSSDASMLSSESDDGSVAGNNVRYLLSSLNNEEFIPSPPPEDGMRRKRSGIIVLSPEEERKLQRRCRVGFDNANVVEEQERGDVPFRQFKAKPLMRPWGMPMLMHCQHRPAQPQIGFRPSQQAAWMSAPHKWRQNSQQYQLPKQQSIRLNQQVPLGTSPWLPMQSFIRKHPYIQHGGHIPQQVSPAENNALWCEEQIRNEVQSFSQWNPTENTYWTGYAMRGMPLGPSYDNGYGLPHFHNEPKQVEEPLAKPPEEAIPEAQTVCKLPVLSAEDHGTGRPKRGFFRRH